VQKCVARQVPYEVCRVVPTQVCPNSGCASGDCGGSSITGPLTPQPEFGGVPGDQSYGGYQDPLPPAGVGSPDAFDGSDPNFEGDFDDFGGANYGSYYGTYDSSYGVRSRSQLPYGVQGIDLAPGEVVTNYGPLRTIDEPASDDRGDDLGGSTDPGREVPDLDEEMDPVPSLNE